MTKFNSRQYIPHGSHRRRDGPRPTDAGYGLEDRVREHAVRGIVAFINSGVSARPAPSDAFRMRCAATRRGSPRWPPVGSKYSRTSCHQSKFVTITKRPAERRQVRDAGRVPRDDGLDGRPR